MAIKSCAKEIAQNAQKNYEGDSEMPDKRDAQSSQYQITINNPADHGYTHEKIFEIFRDNFKTLIYLCLADEKASCHHTHVFVCFSSRVRFSKIKKSFPEAHIEQSKGTVSQNVDYIRKSGKWSEDEKNRTVIEGTFEEWGNQPGDSKGKDYAMQELYRMINDGMSNAEILAENQDYIMQIDKLDKVRTMLLTEQYKGTRRLDLRVTYISGKTGTNKTRSVLDEYGDESCYRVTDYDHPFDGYNCQNILVFDEFRSSLRLKDMLNYLDVYPIELPARYANKYACFNSVYIISNWGLEKQYTELQKDDKESWNAFLRRIHTVKVFTADGIIAYDSVEAYINRDLSFVDLTEAGQKKLPFE